MEKDLVFLESRLWNWGKSLMCLPLESVIRSMQEFILLTPDQLQTLIENSVRKIFSEQNLQHKQEEGQLLNATDAAKFVGIAKQTLYGYTSRRLIPFIKRGSKTVLFRRSDLQSWLMEGKKATIAEINENLNKS